MQDALQALSDSSIAAALREPGAAYPLVNAAHIFSLALVIGSVITLDLRLLGFFRSYALPALGPPLSQMAAVGVVCALVSGFLLFIVRPGEYAGNPAFLTKLVLVVAGVANGLFARYLPHWRRALADDKVPLALKVSALLSLLIWPAALIAGRWIAFV